MILTALLVYGGALALLVLWNFRRRPRRGQDNNSDRSGRPAAANDNAPVAGIIRDLPPHLVARNARQGSWDPPDPAA